MEAKTVSREDVGLDKEIYAYTAVIHCGRFIVGRADLCVKGYTPQIKFGVFDSYDAASKRADELNKELGFSVDNAMKIVGTTMRFENTFEKLIKRIAEFLPKKPNGDIKEDDLMDWLREEGIDDIREALE